MTDLTSTLKRSLASFMAFALIVTSSLTGHVSHAEASPLPSLENTFPTPPETLGFLAERHQGDPHRRVILIQDLHAHLDTQKKIIGLLKFYDQNGLIERPVGLEGARGTWDLSELAAFPIKGVKQKFFDFLLGEAGLTGPEWFALKTNRPTLLYGIDSFEDYMLQKELFKRTLLGRTIAATQIENAQKIISSLEKKLFQKRLNTWQELKDKFDAGIIPIEPYLHKLVKMGSKADVFPSSQLLCRFLASHDPAELKEVLGSDIFYTEVRGYAQEVGVALASSRADANLVKSAYAADLLKRLFRQQSTISEVRQIALRQQECAHMTAQFIQATHQDSWLNEEALLDLIRASTDFYVGALMRNAPIVQNTMALLRQPRFQNALHSNVSPETVIVVVGGFHTQGMVEELKKFGLSYDIITPNITTPFTSLDEARYAARMSGVPISVKKMKGAVDPLIEWSDGAHPGVFAVSASPLGRHDIEDVSEFGADGIRWFTHYRQNSILPYQTILQELGFTTHPVNETHDPAVDKLLYDLSETRKDIFARAGRDLTPAVRNLHVVRGSMNADKFSQLQAEGVISPESTIDTINSHLVIRSPNGDGTYDIFLHDDHAKKLVSDTSLETRVLKLYELLFHENYEVNPGEIPLGDRRTHDQLVDFGASFDKVTESLASGTENAFLDAAGKDLKIDWKAVRVPTSLNSAESMHFAASDYNDKVAEVTQDLTSGKLGDVVYGVNAKVFNHAVAAIDPELEMTKVYEEANHHMQVKYGGHVQSIVSWELPSERQHDLPGFLGVLAKIQEKHPTDWLKKIIVVVTDGGKKTRFATKILNEGYSGLTRLMGGVYGNIREFAFVNALATVELLPGGSQRFIAWAASDNMRKLGDGANIGGVTLNNTKALAKKLKDASVVKGGARIQLFTSDDLVRLDEIADNPHWTEADLERVFSSARAQFSVYPNRWIELLKIIDREKLTQLGMMSADPQGRMMGFMEKEENLGKLVRLFYDTAKAGDFLYKNPFDENLDKRLADNLLRQLQAKPSKTLSKDDKRVALDQLGVSFMQVLYQSRFVGMEDWMTLNPKAVQSEDWRLLKVIADTVWAAETKDGRGQIYILDYGTNYNWMDVADLREWNSFLDTVVADDQVRMALGVQPNVTKDEETINIDGNLVIEGPLGANLLYMERVVVEGGGTLLVTPGNPTNGRTLISNAHFYIPKGQTLIIPAGAKIIDSDLNLLVTQVNIEEGALIERVFSSSTDGTPIVPILWARHDERVALVRILDNLGVPIHTGLVRSLISYPFTKKALNSFDQRSWERLQRQHPEFLGHVRWGSQTADFYGLPDPALGGKSTAGSQSNAAYVWHNSLVANLDRRIDAKLGHRHFSRQAEAFRYARFGLLSLAVSMLLLAGIPFVGFSAGAFLATSGGIGTLYSLLQIDKVDSRGDATYNAETYEVEGAFTASVQAHELAHHIFAPGGEDISTQPSEKRLEKSIELFFQPLVRSVQLSAFVWAIVAYVFRGAKSELSDAEKAVMEFAQTGSVNVAALNLTPANPQGSLMSRTWHGLMTSGKYFQLESTRQREKISRIGLLEMARAA